MSELFEMPDENECEMTSDFGLARMLLRRPRMFYGEAATLRDVLALVRGVAIARYPPHGSGFLPGFNDFVNRRFKAPPIADYITLLKEFGQLSLVDGCQAVETLLEEWKASENNKPDLRV